MKNNQSYKLKNYLTGVTYWYKAGTKKEDKIYHRLNGPAIIYPNGEKEWFKDGELHREDGPAIEGNYYTGHSWYLNGVLHRIGGPAVYNPKNKYDKQIYYFHGTEHREDGPSYISIGFTQYCVNGVLHRIDGPAFLSRIYGNHWYVNGKLHRENGPAIERQSGINSWYYNDIEINCNNQIDFERIIKLKAFI